MPEDGSEPLPNARHERFACELAKGANQSQAYRLAGYTATDPDAKGSRMAVIGSIMARVRWLKKQAATSTVLTIAEKREFLAKVLRTPIGEVDESNPLAQEVTYESVGGQRGRLKRGQDDEGNEECEPLRERIKIKMPSKLEAIKLDNDLSGEGAEAEGQGKLEVIIRNCTAKEKPAKA